MALFADEGLVLATYPYRDRDLVVAVLTRERGSLRGVFRGARGGKTPKSAETQILSHVRFSAYMGPHAEMATLREVEAIQSSFPLASSLERATAAAVTAELLATFFPTAEPADRAFRLGRSVLHSLLTGGEVRTAVAYVEYWALALSGLLPPLDLCTACGAALEGASTIALGRGQPQCARCAGPDTSALDEPALRFLALCRVAPIERLLVEPPPAAARWLDDLVRAEADRPLKALDFFHQHGLQESDPEHQP